MQRDEQSSNYRRCPYSQVVYIMLQKGEETHKESHHLFYNCQHGLKTKWPIDVTYVYYDAYIPTEMTHMASQKKVKLDQL